MSNKIWLFVMGGVGFIVTLVILFSIPTTQDTQDTTPTATLSPGDLAYVNIHAQGINGTEQMFNVAGQAACSIFNEHGASILVEEGVLEGMIAGAQSNYGVSWTADQAGYILGAEVPVQCSQYTQDVIDNGR